MKSCSPMTYHRFFRNLANPAKVKIISALKEKPSSVTELSDKLNIEQSKLSHALSNLNNCNIVTSKQDGKRRIYSLNKKIIIPMLNIIDKHKCEVCRERK